MEDKSFDYDGGDSYIVIRREYIYIISEPMYSVHLKQLIIKNFGIFHINIGFFMDLEVFDARTSGIIRVDYSKNEKLIAVYLPAGIEYLGRKNCRNTRILTILDKIQSTTVQEYQSRMKEQQKSSLKVVPREFDNGRQFKLSLDHLAKQKKFFVFNDEVLKYIEMNSTQTDNNCDSLQETSNYYYCIINNLGALKNLNLQGLVSQNVILKNCINIFTLDVNNAIINKLLLPLKINKLNLYRLTTNQLNLSKCNQIINLDISEANIQQLALPSSITDFDANQLSSDILDLSNCTKITDLNIGFTHIKKLIPPPNITKIRTTNYYQLMTVLNSCSLIDSVNISGMEYDNLDFSKYDKIKNIDVGKAKIQKFIPLPILLIQIQRNLHIIQQILANVHILLKYYQQ